MDRRYLAATLAMVATFATFSHLFREHHAAVVTNPRAVLVSELKCVAGEVESKLLARLRPSLQTGRGEEAQMLAEMNLLQAPALAQIEMEAAQRDREIAQRTEEVSKLTAERAQREVEKAQRKLERSHHFVLRHEMVSAEQPTEIRIAVPQIEVSDSMSPAHLAAMRMQASVLAQNMRAQISTNVMNAVNVRLSTIKLRNMNRVNRVRTHCPCRVSGRHSQIDQPASAIVKWTPEDQDEDTPTI